MHLKEYSCSRGNTQEMTEIDTFQLSRCVLATGGAF